MIAIQKLPSPGAGSCGVQGQRVLKQAAWIEVAWPNFLLEIWIKQVAIEFKNKGTAPKFDSHAGSTFSKVAQVNFTPTSQQQCGGTLKWRQLQNNIWFAFEKQ